MSDRIPVSAWAIIVSGSGELLLKKELAIVDDEVGLPDFPHEYDVDGNKWEIRVNFDDGSTHVLERGEMHSDVTKSDQPAPQDALSDKLKAEIEESVKHTVDKYGDALRKLADEPDQPTPQGKCYPHKWSWFQGEEHCGVCGATKPDQPAQVGTVKTLEYALDWHSRCREQIKLEAAGHSEHQEKRYAEIVNHHRTEALDTLNAWHEEEVRRICLEVIGEDVDMRSKYEDLRADGSLPISIEDDESVEMTGEKLAHLAQYADDNGCNNLRAEQRQRLEALTTHKEAE